MRPMGKLYFLAALLVPLFAMADSPEADWTVMVWMNGDNNLQDYILDDFEEIAAIGSTQEVNIVVQIDRKHAENTHRFRVTQQQFDVTLPDNAKIGERNMVSGDELAEFVRWAHEQYPAQRYALIFSSHGAGYKEINVDGTPVPAPRLPPAVFDAPSRSLNADDTTGPQDALYNAEITRALHTALGCLKLDIMVFDACLMGMVEVAYGMRDVAKVMVASEELVSAAGFYYTPWVRALTADPSIDGVGFAKLLIKEYDKRQIARDDKGRTLAAFDLTGADPIALALSQLSDMLIADIANQRAAIDLARFQCDAYAPGECQGFDCIFHIDLKRFLDRLAVHTSSEDIRNKAQEAGRLLLQYRIDRYAGERRQGRYGSEGLAIYFPTTGGNFVNDHLQNGAYRKDNAHEPVEFVVKQRWADFLMAYYAARGEAVQ